MSRGLVSIVVPVYNAGRYLEELIRSVLHQSYPDWELILVDDGSTDGSAKVAADFARLDRRITATSRPVNRPKGADACRNFGHSKARGEFIAYLDADDMLAPYALSQRVEAAEAEPDADFWVFPAVTFFDSPMDRVLRVHGFRSSRNALGRLVNKCLPFVVWNNLYRKASLDARGILWDERLRSSQDADFNISCLLAGLRFREMDAAPDYFWRSTPGSAGKGAASASHAESNLYYYAKTVERIGKDFGRRYNRDCRMLTLWILNSLLRGGAREQAARLRAHAFVKRRPWFRLRLALYAAWMPQSVGKAGLLAFGLFPGLELRRRRYSRFFPWSPKKAIRVLTARYERKMKDGSE